MPSSASSPAALDVPELAGYRTVNPFAVAALILGLASALVWLSPVLLLAPLAACLVAVIALRQFSAEPERYAGRPLAVAGLCLALLFLGGGLARSVVRQASFSSLAEQFARDWLALVRAGRTREAHQLLQAPDRRAAHGVDLDAYYAAQTEAQKDLLAFESLPQTERLKTSDEPWRLVARNRLPTAAREDEAELRFVRTGPRGEETVRVVVRRTAGTAGVHWQITHVE